MTEISEEHRHLRRFDVFNRITVIVFGIVGTVMMTVTGWAINKIYDFEKRITTIESNRFTSGDANELLKLMMEIQREMATIPKEVPPKWFVDRVNGLDDRLQKVERQGR